MKYLTIDIGNTNTKLGLFHNNDLLTQDSIASHQVGEMLTLVRSYSFDAVAICASGNVNSELLAALNSKPLILLSNQTSVPVEYEYATLETLGTDRIAAVCGARKLYKEADLLVITAGTCITYNFLSKTNVFKGGSISPGMYMRYQAMHEFTNGLPLVSHREYNQLLGQSTEESILSGVQQGVLAEIDGIIKQYQLLYAKIKVIVCGGDTFYLESNLKSEIFAQEFLILHGLVSILQYNLENENNNNIKNNI